MPRIFLPALIAAQQTIQITDEDAHYLAVVLRLKKGDTFEVLSDDAMRYEARIEALSRQRVTASVLRELTPLPMPVTDVVLIQGVLKGQKMDLVVQKAVELGVRAIVPLVTERSQIRETRKNERWKKIAREAARQSGRPDQPEIYRLQEIEEFFSYNTGISGFVFWEEGGKPLSKTGIDATGPVYVFVGPEGGLTKEEVAFAKKSGLVPCTFGPRILRAETAAIAAITLVQFLSGGLQ